MTGAVLRQVKSGQSFERATKTACFDVFLLQHLASFWGDQCCCFDYLNIYS